MQGLKVAQGWNIVARASSTLALGQARRDSIPWHCSRREALGLPRYSKCAAALLPRVGRRASTPSRRVGMCDAALGHDIDKGDAA
ncbi:hypothetical protein HAX54_049892, partial [Datura stramonium]|nr:hypothetical protein [Datura stramonium]